MTDEDIKNEVGNDNINEEATEPASVTKIEAVEEPKEIKTVEEPTEIKTVNTEAVKEEPQFKNKSDRLRRNKVNCQDCGANLTLKTLRYTHKCSKTEEKAVKPKPKAKPKAVEIQPPVSNSILTNEEPLYVQEVKNQALTPPIIKTPQEIVNDNFMLIQQQYINQRREKASNLVQSMFSGGLRNKRR